MIACVLLEIKSKNLDKTFDYLIPEELKEHAHIGRRVLVPFGMQELEGYILELKEKSNSQYELKNIKKVLDEEDILNKELLHIGECMKEMTLSSLSKCYSTMLPVALKAKKQTNIKKKYESLLSLQIDFDKALQSCHNQVQQEIIKLFDSSIIISKKEANEISFSAVKTLIKNGILQQEQKETYRYQIDLQELEPKKKLNIEQEHAYNKIISSFNTEKIFLLHGVTGSGKTEVYMQAIDKVLQEKKQALILVPEISLTPQFINNFAKRFGQKIAVLHSGLSNGEKYDEWRKIIREEVDIVIGARSSIFAPLKNIGIIIIDECHSDSYKQENSPKYQVFEIAKIRSHYHKCPIILGSATPTLEMMARAQKNVFEYLELKKRASHNPLPNCLIVDMKEERKKHYFVISSILEEKIKERLNNQEQTMILLNRRGHSTIIQCSSCGFIYKCPYCDISLTYHKTSRNLRCHYCGYTKYIDQNCPQCQEDALNYYGLGTEKLENHLKNRFPEAKIIRMDTDTTSRKGSLERIIKDFQNQKYDILIGTQMISKGHDFPKVTLVGIVNADSSLNIPDFRSGEKTFALLYQASGRAGRDKIPGEVVLETMDPENKILKFVAKQDYLSFYQYEMNIRKKLKYPPYYYLTHIVIKSKDYEEAKKEAHKVVLFLKPRLNSTTILLGPTIASMFRINNIYHFEILIKYRFDDQLKKALKELDQIFLLNKKVDIDIDLSY